MRLQPAARGESEHLPLDQVTLVVVDVETTGLNAARGDRVCEVGLAVCRGAEVLATYDTLVNPRRPISAGASAVNRLSDADLADAPPFAAVAGQVASLLTLGISVAHNAPFDLSFLSRELALAGLPPPSQGALDTLAIARSLLPFGRHGLGHLAGRLGLPDSGESHRALADALTTHTLMQRLAMLAGSGRAATLARMLDLQGGLVPWPTAEVDRPDISLPIHLAGLLQPGRVVRITYMGVRGELSARTVEPSVIYESGSALYMDGFCHLRQEQRTFRIDRILDCAPA